MGTDVCKSAQTVMKTRFKGLRTILRLSNCSVGMMLGYLSYRQDHWIKYLNKNAVSTSLVIIIYVKHTVLIVAV